MNPTPETNQARTPDEQVARIIVHELGAGELVAPSQVEQIRIGLASGSLRAADWRLIAENALALEARHGKTTP